MGIFVYAFTKTGKSTVSRKYKNVIDMESTKYKYLGNTEENEKSKGKADRIINPAWPQNYFRALESVKDKYDYILISDDICNDWLLKNDIKYYQVFPGNDLKQEYIDRCRNRGNNDSFISYFALAFDEWVDACKNDMNADKRIELKAGQYLEHVLSGLVKK